jgi:competence protein ComEC
MTLGILADDRLELPALAATAVFFAAGGLLLIPSSIRQYGWLLIAAAATGIGALNHHAHLRYFPLNHISTIMPASPHPAILTGVIATTPQVSEPADGPLARFRPQQPKTRFILEAQGIDGPEGELPIRGKAHVVVYEPALRLSAGARVRIEGRLYPIRRPANPGEFDWGNRLRRQRVLAGVSVKHGRAVHVLAPESKGFWDRWVGKLRLQARFLLTDNAVADNEGSLGLLEAMILGQRSRVSSSLDESYRRAGVAHFLSASGLHLGIVALFGWCMGTVFRLSRKPKAWLILSVVVAYVFVAEPRPPILRAGVVASLACAAVGLGRPMSHVNWLSASAIVILAMRPTELFTPGFQLSFGVLISIMVLSPVIDSRIFGYRRDVARLSVSDSSDWFAAWIRRSAYEKFAQLISTAAAAWIGAWPIVAYHFNMVTPYGAICSVVMFPLVLAAMMLGLSKLVLSIWMPSLGAILGPVLKVVTSSLATMANWMAALPFSVIPIASPAEWWIGGYYGFLALIAYRERVGRRWGWPAIAVPIWIVLLYFGRSIEAPPADSLNIDVLGVGAGSATAIWIPDGGLILYDAGSMSRPRVYETVIKPYLIKTGASEIRHLVISHPNLDHFSAVPGLLRDFPVGTIWISPFFEKFVKPDTAAGWVLEEIDRLGVKIARLSAGDRLPRTGDAAVKAVWPLRGEPEPATSNDSSIVLRIQYAGKSALLSGDVEVSAQRALIEAADLKSDFLLLPHHGAVEDSTAEFISAVDPKIVVRSTNKSDLSQPSEIADLVGSRTYFNTADVGAVSTTLGESGVVCSSFRGANE